MSQDELNKTDIPDPEVVPQAKRRRFSAEYKLCILEEVDACTEPGQIGALLRRAYQTEIELLYLDEIFKTPQLAGTIERQLRFVEAAVAELRQALNLGKT